MGTYDSAQIANLVGNYILVTISRIIDLKQVVFYRDDDLFLS